MCQKGALRAEGENAFAIVNPSAQFREPLGLGDFEEQACRQGQG